MTDERLEGYAIQYRLYVERLAKDGLETELTFEKYVELREKNTELE